MKGEFITKEASNSVIPKMVGLTFSEIICLKGDESKDDELKFIAQDGKYIRFFHEFDCCESVTIEDIVGDLSDLINTPITLAEEVVGDAIIDDDPGGDDAQWSFYKFATIKGYVTVRWFGTSNGYYSTTVNIHSNL